MEKTAYDIGFDRGYAERAACVGLDKSAARGDQVLKLVARLRQLGRRAHKVLPGADAEHISNYMDLGDQVENLKLMAPILGSRGPEALKQTRHMPQQADWIRKDPLGSAVSTVAAMRRHKDYVTKYLRAALSDQRTARDVARSADDITNRLSDI